MVFGVLNWFRGAKSANRFPVGLCLVLESPQYTRLRLFMN